MVITPNTDVILLKCPLELDEKNQLNFSSKSAQYNYFNSLPKFEAGNDFTYQRKDNIIRVNAKFDDIIEYNYVMYRNDNYSSKWFYAFITKMEYINDNMTAVSIKTDVFQTWQFDLTYKQTFVEREHTNNDTIGANTIDEGLETGEYVINYCRDIDITASDTYSGKGVWAIAGLSITPTGAWEKVSSITGPIGSGNNQQGVPTALDYVIIQTADLTKITKIYDANSKSDAIATVFVIPGKIIEKLGQAELLTMFQITSEYGTITGFNIDSNEDPIDFGTYTSYGPNSINGYVPKNNKLLTYPYCYERLTNNGGVDVIYRWEDFANRNAKFKIKGAIVQGMSIKAFPVDYLGGEENETYVYGITGQKLPTCGWNSDFYLSWVNQQGANLALQTGVSVGNNIIGTIGNVANATNVGSAVTGLGMSALNMVSTIGNAMQRIREAELVPPQTRGNINSGDVNFSIGKSGFTIYDMNIKAEYARQIDDYFSMFGYKTNRVKIPNVKGRANWNYVKTIGCYIEADIPQDDLQEIKNMFDNGLTIWHRTNTFLDYSQNNPIV